MPCRLFQNFQTRYEIDFHTEVEYIHTGFESFETHLVQRRMFQNFQPRYEYIQPRYENMVMSYARP